jgi:hypothetical protein
MAKIILVTEKANQTSWQLAEALRSQQHEVIFLTSHGESVEDTHGIEFMGYFKKWNLLEGLRIIPGLFGLQPQILHLLLEEDKLNTAQMMLATFAKSHPACILTTSLLNIRRGLKRTNPVRYLVEESDIITCPTIETLGQLRGLNTRSPRQGRGILPPVLNLAGQTTESGENIEAVSNLIEQWKDKPFFLVPFNEPGFDPDSEYFDHLRALVQKNPVILWGSYSHWPLRERKKLAAWFESFGQGQSWGVTGSLSATDCRELMEKCEALVLAGQTYSPIDITEFYFRAIQTKCSLILDSRQASVHSALWRNAVNCWIVDARHLQRDLIKLLTRPHFKLPEVLSETIEHDRQVIDGSLNELNRLYSRALTQKNWR